MKKVRFGILGTARIAEKRVVPAIHESATGDVVAIAGRDGDRARRFADAHDIRTSYGSYDELLADPEIDAVYIPLPTGLHREWSVRSMAAGKHVLCEKPLADTAADASMVADAAKRYTVHIAEGGMFRYHPLNTTVREMIARGDLGTVTSIRASFYGPIDESDIRFIPNLGGGSIRDLGYYCVGIARFLTGEEPDSVKGFVNWHHPGDVDRSGVAILQFPSGIHAFTGFGFKSFFDCSYEIIGRDGRILVDRGAMVAWPGESFVVKYWNSDGYREIDTPAADPYKLMIENFCASVRNTTPPGETIDDAIKNLVAMDTIRESAGDR